MDISETGLDSWLESKPPWTSATSSPFVPHATSQSLTGYGTTTEPATLPSTLNLLSHLLRTITASNLEEITFNAEEPFGIKLGEGSTYRVEKRRVSDILGQKSLWVAVKRAKFRVSKAKGEWLNTDASAYPRLRAVLLEIEILLHPPLRKHPNIPRLLGYSWDEDAPGYAPLLVMDLAIFGDMQTLFAKETLSESEEKTLCLDIASGLEALHACMIVHGDVKQENILVFPHPDRRFLAKVSDFELALLENDVPHYRGTKIYNAPEVQLQNLYDPRTMDKGVQLSPILLQMCDVFSFGLLTFEIFCGGRRYYEFQESETFQHALVGKTTEKQDILRLALSFLRRARPFALTLVDLCDKIFRCTLHYSPLDRLKGGWSSCKEILDDTFDTTLSLKESPRVWSLHGPMTDYSVLGFCYQIRYLSKGILGEQMLAELQHMAQSALSREQRGRAFFDLCLLYALGRIASPTNLHESLSWITGAALLGNEAALTLGSRIFQANDLPVPTAFLNTSSSKNLHEHICLLQGALSDEFYANAVRIYWTRELRSSIFYRFTGWEQVQPKDKFDTWIEKMKMEVNPAKSFLEFADKHFLLHKSVCLQNVRATKLLLESGCSINTQTKDGLTPLHVACRCANMELIFLLLKCGADASLTDMENISPLHWLVLFSSDAVPTVGKALVENKADVNTIMKYQSYVFFDSLGLALRATPLWWACMCRSRVAVQTLLSLGADPYQRYVQHQDERVDGCLSIALGTVCADIVELLFNHTGILSEFSDQEKESLYNFIGVGLPNDFQRWCMHGNAYQRAYTEVMNTLSRYQIPFPLQPQATRSAMGSVTPLARAAMSANVLLARECLQRGANTNDRMYTDGSTALTQTLTATSSAVSSPFKVFQMVELLLGHGASLEAETHVPPHRSGMGSALHLACRHWTPPPVLKLLASAAPSLINHKQGGKTPLQILANTAEDDDSLENARILLSLGADPDIESDHWGFGWSCCYTATACSIFNEDWVFTKLLLDRGASTDIGVSGRHRGTLLHLVVYKAFVREARKNPADKDKMTLLLRDLLDHPLAHRRDILNDMDYRGYSPLVWAALWGLPWIVEILLEHGASAEVPKEGVTIFDMIQHTLENPPEFTVEDETYTEGSSHKVSNTMIPWCKLSEYRYRLQEVLSLLQSCSGR